MAPARLQPKAIKKPYGKRSFPALDLVLGDEKAKGLYRFYVEMKKKMRVLIKMILRVVGCLTDINHLVALPYKRIPIYHNQSILYNAEYEPKAIYS